MSFQLRTFLAHKMCNTSSSTDISVSGFVVQKFLTHTTHSKTQGEALKSTIKRPGKYKEKVDLWSTEGKNYY